VSRQQYREETPLVTPTTPNGNPGYAGPAEAETPSTPQAPPPQPQRASRENPNIYYEAEPKAPQQVPPPPPRPDKVRHEAQDPAPEQYYAAHGSLGSNNPYVPAAAEPRSSTPSEKSNYVQSAARRQARSIFGRA